jgi:O-methyltransferase
MDWKRSVNAGLSRVTGHKLVKAERPAAPPPPRPPKPKRGIPRHYDEEARQIIRTVKPRTMTAHEKLYALILATRYVVDRDIPGAVVECGVWRGGSMQAVAHTLHARGVTDRELHLFDTFEGMPEPTEKDRLYSGRPASDVLERSERTANVWAIASLDDVRAGMAETGYPGERIHFHPGRVEDTIATGAPARIAILRLDTDWYDSTKHELEHLYDRVPSGGVIVIDDYGFWQGAREAVDEYLDRRRERLLLLPMGSGRIAVKP